MERSRSGVAGTESGRAARLTDSFSARHTAPLLLLVLIVEVLNSAIEAVVDRWGPEHHDLAGRAKDMGSAAVFLSDVNAVVCWLLILWPQWSKDS